MKEQGSKNILINGEWSKGEESQQKNRQTGMQEASDELYLTDERQAGETGKQEYILLKK